MKMKVEQFKEKYEALQKEGNEIYAQMRPLLKRLKSLAKKSVRLANRADGDKGLYENVKVKVGKSDKFIRTEPRPISNWDTFILFRLWDFGFLIDDPTNSAIDGIDNVLYNLKHTKFKTVGKRQQ